MNAEQPIWPNGLNVPSPIMHPGMVTFTRVGGESGAWPGTGPLGVPVQPRPARTPASDGTADGAGPPFAQSLAGDVAVPAGVPILWTWNAADGRITCSALVRRTLHLPPAADLGLVALRRLVHPDDRDRFDDVVLSVAAGIGAVQDTLRFCVPGDVEKSLHVWAGVRSGPDGLVGAFGGLVDVTGAGDDGLGALHDSLARLHAAEELTGVGLWEWDPATAELLWTAPMYALVGTAPGALHPSLRSWHDAVHPLDRERAERLEATTGERSASGDGERVETLRVVGADGALRYVRCWSVLRRDRDGVRVHGAAVEVSRQVRDQVRLERLSATDAVTGLLNRHGLGQRLRHLLAAADGRLSHRLTDDVGLVLLDLDRFKAVNDALGHHVGDALLVEVSRRLGGLVPEGSVTARMGGDEFAVVPPPGTGPDRLRGLAGTIVTALRVPYVLPGSAELLTCSASVGVTSRGGREVGAEELLAEADLALYRAKDSGRARYVVFDDQLRTEARARHLAERMLRTALDEDRLALLYQPVVDLVSGRTVGAEALVRIRDDCHRPGSLLLPDAFIDVAEETGLVVELDRWVIDHALDELARWTRRGRGAPGGTPWLAVNVSPRSMAQPGVVLRLLDGLAERGLPPHLLKVELTERSFLGADAVGERALRDLIGSGVPVGIDDFGTGYSALAYLQRFDLDFMKIDRSFVASVGSQGRADAVVTAIVDLAHAHGMQVTAEGIEHPRQAVRLREIGCDLAQGYHFGRPAGAADLVGR